MKKISILIMLLGFLASCSDDSVISGPLEPGEFIEASASEGQVIIENKLERPIYYMLIERKTLAFVLFDLSETWESVKSKSTKRVDLTEIYGYENKGDEIILNYWANKDPQSEDIKNIIIGTD